MNATEQRPGRVRESLFPRSRAYRAPDPARGAPRVREAAGALAPPETERALQCVWFDPELRPARLRTVEGEPLIVEHPGQWNLGPGPDFLGAAVRIGPGERRIEGDVEIHVRSADWAAHGHAADPRYARVRLHVTFQGGRLPADVFPPGAVQVSLREALAADPTFSFDHIDLAAYPYAAPAAPAPCALELAGWPPDDKEALLDAAGEERLRRKAERLAAAVAERGPEQALYEELLTALGYPDNKIPFRRLAAAVPLAALRELAGDDALRAEALLAGAAGLLPPRYDADWTPASRRHARLLWDAWWKNGGAFANDALDQSAWRLSGMRPANHPVRRIAGAAWLFSRPEPPLAVLRRCAAGPGDPIAALLDWLDVRPDTFWGRHASYRAPRAAAPVALIGRGRAVALVINVCVPLLAALDVGAPFAAKWLDRLPPEAPSDRLRAIAHTLFGPGHPPSLYRTGLRRQGLLQIFQDYCLHNRSACAACEFPGILRRMRAAAHDNAPIVHRNRDPIIPPPG